MFVLALRVRLKLTSEPSRIQRITSKMPLRWRCCKCDHNWMTVKNGSNICQMSDCRHEKCSNCETKSFDVPMGPGGGEIFDCGELGTISASPMGCFHENTTYYCDISDTDDL